MNTTSSKFSQFFFIILLIFAFNTIAQNDTFSVRNIKAKSGEKVTGKLVIEQALDDGTFIPVSIINGNQPGPVLTLIAGNHGTEYVPIITLQELLKEINPESISGTLIMVHIANVPSFNKRTVYYSPVDQKNINRVYPGRKNGTLSERIAFTISSEIMNQSDYLIDLHGGEFNERLINWTYYCYDCPDEEICKKAKTLAQAFGSKYLIPTPYSLVPDTVEYTYCEFAALRKGVATITVEIGDQGQVAPEKVDFAKKGILNVMRTIGMLKGETFINENSVYLVEEFRSYSNYDGIFYDKVIPGQFIPKGTLMGYTTNFLGDVLEEYHSSDSGIVVKIYTSPAINKGDNVITISSVADKFDK